MSFKVGDMVTFDRKAVSKRSRMPCGPLYWAGVVERANITPRGYMEVVVRWLNDGSSGRGLLWRSVPDLLRHMTQEEIDLLALQALTA